jgi:hypothetical protein
VARAAHISAADTLGPERAVLGAVLLENSHWGEAKVLREDKDLSLAAHRIIFCRMRNLAESGRPIDMVTLSDELGRHDEIEAIGGVAYLSSLIDGVPDRPSIAHYVTMVRTAAGVRHIAHGVDAIADQARKGADIADLRARLADLDRVASQYENNNGSASIRAFDSVPDLLSMEIEPMDYLVQALIPARSLTLWTGVDGTAKTYLAQNLALAVASGGRFLGGQCRKRPVLYCDYENADFVMRARFDLMGAVPNPNLKVWGTWLPNQPPQIGDQLLFTIAKDVQPLIILDPFRYSHGADENDSTEMMAVMRDLRACVAAGATLIIFHHPAKVEGSTGRGSSAIRGAVDLAYMQELSDETGLITLRCVKNRFGERPVLTIKPDFEEGTFQVTDSPQYSKTMAELDALSEIICATPWLSQNQVIERWRGPKRRGMRLLKEYTGSRWEMVKKGQSSCYGPPVQRDCTSACTSASVDPNQVNLGTSALVHPYKGAPVAPVSASLSEPVQQPVQPVPTAKRTELLV